MVGEKLPRVHGEINRSVTAESTTTSARDAELTPGTATQSSLKPSEETQLCSRKMRIFTRTRLLPIIVLVCCVYLVYRSFGSTFNTFYSNKLGAALPELTVFGATGGREAVDQPKVNIVNDFAIKGDDNIPNVPEEHKTTAAHRPRPDGNNILGSVACIPLKSTASHAKICLHNPSDDESVSRTLLTTGSWDDETVRDFKLALDTDPDLGVIDIGANLGVYSLLAAYLGRRVLAVDACHYTLLHLKKSLEINSYTDRVSVMEAAIMESRGYARLTIPDGDYGSAFPTLVSQDSFIQSEVDAHKIIKAIKLEDIIEYVTSPRVILKIDINGEEYGILQEAKRLFEVRDVKYIFMVFSPEKGTQLGKKLGARFLQEQGYVPKRSLTDKELFIALNEDDRPSHLVWEKQYGRKAH